MNCVKSLVDNACVQIMPDIATRVQGFIYVLGALSFANLLIAFSSFF